MLEPVLKALGAEDHAPMYQRIEIAMRSAVESGQWSPGQALPAERDLSAELSVSRITVRKAVDRLVNDGLLARKRGSGTYVAQRVKKDFAKLSSFSEDMISRGRTPSSIWIKCEEGIASPEESLVLTLSPGSKVFRYHRIRYADGAAMAVEYTTVPGFCFDAVTDVDTSIYMALERKGYRPTRALQRLRAGLFTEAEAELLAIDPNSPGLLIERRGFSSNGTPVEHTQSCYRGDSYDFVAELGESS